MRSLVRRMMFLIFAIQVPTAFAETEQTSETHINFRYRLESVDQRGLANDALASTLRTRLNFLSAPHAQTRFFIEADNVSYLGNEAFNNTRNGETRYPVVVDPDGTGINQFYFRRKTQNYTSTLGRYRILDDDQRFIGGVGWRQNEQTYDGMGVHYHPDKNLDASWHYVNRVSRIFGPDRGTPSAHLNFDSHLLRIRHDRDGQGQITGYIYLLDFEDAASLSNKTIGFRYQNAFQFKTFTLPLTVEYAHQKDYGANNAQLSLDYLGLNLKFETRHATFSVGTEILEGSRNGGFQTPLATLHKFQGWADKFLTTPATGIDDKYFGIAGETNHITWSATYHDFSAEQGGNDYGSELDLSISREINSNFTGSLKWAKYNADGFATDTSKAWLTLIASF